MTSNDFRSSILSIYRYYVPSGSDLDSALQDANSAIDEYLNGDDCILDLTAKKLKEKIIDSIQYWMSDRDLISDAQAEISDAIDEWTSDLRKRLTKYAIAAFKS